MVMSDRLLLALRELPVEWPAVPEVSAGTAANVEPGSVVRPSSFVLRLTGAVAAVVVVVGFVAPVREAVADWLGIGVVRIELVEALPDDLGVTLDLGALVDVGSVDLPAPGALGEPSAAFVRDGEASLVWAPSDDLPEVVGSGVGAIFTRFDGSLEPGVEKSLGLASTLEVVTVRGERAYWIEGEPHSFAYRDADGHPIETTARLAGNTLIWEAGGYTWRFESGLAVEHVLPLFGE
jgi:hypothetical protein